MRSLALHQLAAEYDCLVVGAGPAGLAAASGVADLGLSTLLVDEHAKPGGPMYRQPAPDMPAADAGRGARLLEAFERSSAALATSTVLWWIARSPAGQSTFVAGLRQEGSVRTVAARHVVAATGALERPFPVPGGTRPGVLTVGAAWNALDHASLPEGRLILAGNGPLLYRLLARLKSSGRKVEALLDTTPFGNWRPAAEHAGAFLLSRSMAEGIRLLARSHWAAKTFRTVRDLRVQGDGDALSVVFRHGGIETGLACDTLVLGQGTVSDIGLSQSLGCEHIWDRDQLAWLPRLDAWCGSSVDGISIAGDAAGVAGPEAAIARGRLAALDAAARLGSLDAEERDRRATSIRLELAAAMRGRRFVDLLYRPSPSYRIPQEPTTHIRHGGGMTAGQVRDAIAAGAMTAADVTAILGRDLGKPPGDQLCALTLAEILAGEKGSMPGDKPPLPPSLSVRPIGLNELGSLTVP